MSNDERTERTPWSYLLKPKAEEIANIGCAWLDSTRDGIIFPDANVFVGSTLDAYFATAEPGSLDAGLIRRSTQYLGTLRNRLEGAKGRIQVHPVLLPELRIADRIEETFKVRNRKETKRDPDRNSAIGDYVREIKELEKAIFSLPRYDASDRELNDLLGSLGTTIDSITHYAEGKTADRQISASALAESLRGNKEVVIVTTDTGVKKLTAAKFFLLSSFRDDDTLRNFYAGGHRLRIHGYNFENGRYEDTFDSTQQGNGLRREIIGDIEGASGLGANNAALIERIATVTNHLGLVKKEQRETGEDSAERWLREAYEKGHINPEVIVRASPEELRKYLQDMASAHAIAGGRHQKLAGRIEKDIESVYTCLREALEPWERARAGLTESLDRLVSTLKKTPTPESATGLTKAANDLVKYTERLRGYSGILTEHDPRRVITSAKEQRQTYTLSTDRESLRDILISAGSEAVKRYRAAYSLISNNPGLKGDYKEDKKLSPENARRLTVHVTGLPVSEAAKQIGCARNTVVSSIERERASLIEGVDYTNLGTKNSDCFRFSPSGIEKLKATIKPRKKREET